MNIQIRSSEMDHRQDVNFIQRQFARILKLSRYIRVGSHITEMRNEDEVIVGFLSQSSSSCDVIFVKTYLVHALEISEGSYSHDVISSVAAALALRGKWNRVRCNPTNKLVELYVKIMISTPLNIYDLGLCGRLLGGGILHLIDNTTQPQLLKPLKVCDT